MTKNSLDNGFNPKDDEARLYEGWESSGAFSPDVAQDGNPFTIMMPPPNVTGSLHMGHALNTTLQDIMIRYHRMKGDNTLWQPGTDHAGIATQMVVERMLDKEGTNRRDLGREKFLERVWDWKEQSGGTIVNQMRRLGATPDWSRERFTMDEGLSKAVRKVFVRLYKENLIYKDKRLVNWDPKLKTAISDLEVEQKEQKGHMWHIRYPVEGDVESFITVATTRPETLLGDTAVAVHPDDERYKDLIGKSVAIPLTERLVPIVADEYADPEQGSGAVKITPAHDFNDFEVGKRHDLPMISVLDIHGCMNENCPEDYRGMDRFEARKKILGELEDLDLLVEVEDIKHSVPYGDRSGVVIEPFLTDQWYVDTPTLAKPAIEAVRSGKTTFHPKQYENMYFDWLENQLPWCISRQLWWGHQIPAWYGPDGQVFVAETEDEAYKESDAFYGESVTLVRDDDVLDTWFSSALWPFSTLGWPDKTPELDRYYPGSVLVTGFDIITFWVSRMMMMGLHFMDEVPFKDVYIHALVRDSKGQKMSKSKGNVMDPLDLIEEYGADALRFTMTAMAAQGRDIRLSTQRIEGYRNFTTKIWNAARYAQMNGCTPVRGFDPLAVKKDVNQWIVAELSATKQTVEKAIDTYRFNEAANALYQFVWNTYCDWYVEFTKPLLQGDSADKAEIQQTMAWVLDQILIVMNPVMPFITEELYDRITDRDQRLIDSAWPEYGLGDMYATAHERVQWLQTLIGEVRSVRADMNVPAGAVIPLLIKDADEGIEALVSENSDIIARLARVKDIAFVAEPPKGAIQAVIDKATLLLPVADSIDLDKERARLRKELKKLEGDIKTTEAKLGNEKFVQNAPEAVIAEQKERKVVAEKARDKITDALAQLDLVV